jgi:hypothetical protein
MWIVGTIGAAVVVTVGLMLGQLSLAAVVFVAVGLVITAQVAVRIGTDLDRSWLATLLPLAFVAKMIGVVARYLMVTVLYRSGDSFRYYNTAIELVHDWRNLDIPTELHGSAGTKFVEAFTSLLFIPGTPSFLVSFMIFGSLAFAGVVFFYLAFRPWIKDRRVLFLYAVLVFFMPSIVFWPSSIGKDAIMILALGLGAYGASRLLRGEYLNGTIFVVLGTALGAGVRPHVATLVAAAVLLALLLARRTDDSSGWMGRLVIAGVVVIGLGFVAFAAADDLDLDPSSEGLDEFLQETQINTSGGSSAVVGKPVSNPLDLPEATIRVLLRPFPHEAGNAAMLLSALETTLLLAIVVWRLPHMWRNVRRIRGMPYVLFAALYTAGFVVAFSAIFNLGILARQRVQVLPLLLVVLVGLGWDSVGSTQETDGRLETARV